MKENPNYGLLAVAAALAVIGALLLGVPLGSLATLGVLLLCPLMMLFMMRGMHGGGMDDQHHDAHRQDATRNSGSPR